MSIHLMNQPETHMDYKNRITDIEQLNREIEPFRPISNPHILRQLKDYLRLLRSLV